ncbi:natural cytotoxicity triggering receptor 3 ligand 1-like isoform 2-T12 [Anomaloglossus baeobatrachus]|uniref:natural cytotoxicity triggering receptor 3 ligand 1-like n=1 Tax=Anomaloglossus baeobatrachus TaxID=238106 RepID=UPI003F4FE849
MKTFLCLLLRCLSVLSLELTGPSVNVARLGSDARVPCTFKVDKPPVDPNHLTILWQFLDKEILSYKITVKTTSPRYSLSTEALTIGIANLTISNVQITNGGRYKCSVIYKSEEKKNEVWLDIRAPPQVAITRRTVIVNAESVLRCSATGFFPIDIEVKWFRGSERLSNVTLDQPQRNPDRTYSVNSTVTITPTEEDRERIFSCRVQHMYLQEPLQVDFQLVYQDRSSAGIIAACSVSVIILMIVIITAVLWRRRKLRKSQDITPLSGGDIVAPPKLIAGEKAVLYCTVDNAPEDLWMNWLIRRAGEEQEIQMSQMRRYSEQEKSLQDKSYVVKSQREGHPYPSSLSFIPHMERHKDENFICRGVSGQHKDKKFPCKTIYGLRTLIPQRKMMDPSKHIGRISCLPGNSMTSPIHASLRQRLSSESPQFEARGWTCYSRSAPL